MDRDPSPGAGVCRTLPLNMLRVIDMTRCLLQTEPIAVYVEEGAGRKALAGCVARILPATHPAGGGLIMAEVLVRDLDVSVVEKLKARAAAKGRSLQAELRAILEA
jgi:hypothetical protein